MDKFTIEIPKGKASYLLEALRFSAANLNDEAQFVADPDGVLCMVDLLDSLVDQIETQEKNK